MQTQIRSRRKYVRGRASVRLCYAHLSICRVPAEAMTFCIGIVSLQMTPYIGIGKSNRKAMNRNWSNQKANVALKTKTGNK